MSDSGFAEETKKVVSERKTLPELHIYYVGFDRGVYRILPLVEVLADAIPDYVLGPHIRVIETRQLRRRLKEAAHRLYTTENYQKRGEFGEVILHVLLRDFLGTTPLLSKIYFKDAANATVHGFDGVHVSTAGDKKILWLGESKLYKSGSDGVRALAGDLVAHLKANYLRSEFLLIGNKLADLGEETKYWRDKLHEYTKLQEILDSICIPMVCTYESDIYSQHSDETKQFIDAVDKEASALFQEFNNQLVSKKPEVSVLLLLFPIKNKKDLIDKLHVKVDAWRNA